MPRPVQASDLLALRPHVPDSTLLDWVELEQLLPPRPCRIRTDELRRLWCCSQPTVSRRITRLHDAGLLEYRPSAGWYRIRRLGPPPVGTTVPLINQIDCAASDLAL